METGAEQCFALVPLLMAYPCCCCAMPGTICQLCGSCFCAACAHVCEREQSHEEDDGEDDVAQVVASTGGSEDNYLDQNLVFSQLRKLQMGSSWTQYEDSLWLRCHRLPELNVCYIVDDQNSARRFGSLLGDWRNVMDKMCWHHAGIVVFNVSRRKAYVVEAGAAPKPTVALQALRYLRQMPTSLGIVMEGEDEDMLVAHLEGWWRPDESNPVKRSIVRDKLIMAIVRLNKRVEFYWP